MTNPKFRLDDRKRVVAFSVAFHHPLRSALLLQFANGRRACAKKVAEDELVSRATCAYHMAKLRKIGALQVTGTKRRGGATEVVCGVTSFGIELFEWAEGIERGPRSE